MPQADAADYRARIVKLQSAMRQAGVAAMVLEPGPAMMYLTGVRWGRSERTFAVLLPAAGEPLWVLPAFEEMRARELIRFGEIRIWQEDESPYQLIAEGFQKSGAASGRLAIDDSARFFVFDGIRKLAPRLEYVSAGQMLAAAGVDLTQRR